MELKDPAVIPALAPYLQSSNRAERCDAGLVLAGLGDERGLDAILAELGDTGPRPDREGRIRSDGTPDTEGIRQRRQDRYHAVHVLGLLKDARSVPVLIPFLKDGEIGYKVAWALGEIGDPAAIEPLAEALGDKDPDVRVIAMNALAKLRARAPGP